LSGPEIELIVEIRSCDSGEEFTEIGKCVACEGPNYYLLEAPSTVASCKDCPTAKATCEGGSKIYPRPGYWRSSRYSENFLACYNEEACLGKNHNESNYGGECSTGYMGILCTYCDLGYSRTGSFSCSKCPTHFVNALRLLALFIALIVGITILIRSTL